MTETTETPKPAIVAGRLDGLVRRLYQHALPDPHDEREVLHAPLLLEAADAIERESIRADWFMQRCDALQQAQQHMRDPERKMVCDILANGRTFVTPAGRFSGSA